MNNFNINAEYIMSKNRDKFVELAEKRVQKAIKSIRLIGNLANKTNYSYGDDDLRKIFGTLKKELTSAQKKFEITSDESHEKFRL